MRNAKVINNLRQYWKFCQDSAGFFPKSWLEYFFKDCQDLLDMKVKRQKGEQVIGTSLDSILTNIEYLPLLYEAITNRTVMEIEYKPFDEEQVTLMFHSHYLKSITDDGICLVMQKEENRRMVTTSLLIAYKQNHAKEVRLDMYRRQSIFMMSSSRTLWALAT